MPNETTTADVEVHHKQGRINAHARGLTTRGVEWLKQYFNADGTTHMVKLDYADQVVDAANNAGLYACWVLR